MLLVLSAAAVSALVVGVLVVLVLNSFWQEQQEQQRASGSTPAPGSCKVNRPVCYYGVTYPNTCELEPLGITGYTVGACPTQPPDPHASSCMALTEGCMGLVPYFMMEAESCGCPGVYQPVCGQSKEGDFAVDYGSECVAKCRGSPKSTWKPGTCPALPPLKDCKPSDSACVASCACPATYEPVCGLFDDADGRDFANVCLARCMGAHGLLAGSCSQYPWDMINDPRKP